MSVAKKAGVSLGDPQLDGLLERARWLAVQSRLFAEALPRELSGHCRLANIRDDLLVVLVDSPAWATRLRMLGPSLLSELQQHAAFRRCRRIDPKVEHISKSVTPQSASRGVSRSSVSVSELDLLKAQFKR